MNKHFSSGGLGITNFDIKEKPIYEAAIIEYNCNNLFIGDAFMPLQDDPNFGALYYKEYRQDLSAFWRIFYRKKAISIILTSAEITCGD